MGEEMDGSSGQEGGDVKLVGCAQSYREEVQEPEILGEMEVGIAEVSREQKMTLPSQTVTNISTSWEEHLPCCISWHVKQVHCF